MIGHNRTDPPTAADRHRLRKALVQAHARGKAIEDERAVALRAAFREELEAHLKTVKSANAAAVADENEILSKYLKEEKRVVEEKLASLPPPE